MEPARLAGDRQRLLVDVRLERPVCPRRLALPTTGVLVSDVAAKGRPLTADFAFRSHNAG